MKETKEHNGLQNLIRSLPSGPGVYRYLDSSGKVIYVGKAKNLKKRVASYFTKKHVSGKLKLLVKKIADIEFVVTDTERDALFLENNLIKKYQPRYNVQLKDDKTFPWLCIKKEPFPRVFPTRNLVKDGSEYYGPYASVKLMRTMLDMIRQLYPVRTCALRLTKKNIDAGKFKVCLEYHIGNCLAPCVGKQSEEEYDAVIDQIRSIIKGNISQVIAGLRLLMHKAAEEMNFEKAQLLKEKIGILENYKSKSTIVNPRIENVDVLTLINEENVAYANYLRVIKGAIVQAHTVELKKKLDETEEELLLYALTDFRNRFHSTADEIILPVDPGYDLKGLKITVPRRGDRKQLLDLSRRNALYLKMEREKHKELTDPDRHRKRILETLKKDLRMHELPAQIECFDNSNFQGDYPVAAMVQFVDARPNKQGYRHYNIKTVTGPDDYASMEEVIYRRYSRLLKEKKSLPQLIVVDGGKGQLNAAAKSLEKLGLYGKITLIGIAKRLEELYFPHDPLPLYLDKKSESLKVIQYLRDEAHRFGITHHRSRLKKGTIKSELTSIKGVGFATAQKLLWKFKSVKNIKKASFDDLAEAVGKVKARVVHDYFSAEEKT